MNDIDIADQFKAFDALHDSVFLIDAGGLVAAVNTSAVEILGLTAMQVIGSPFSNYFPDFDTRIPEGDGDGDVIEITGRRVDGSGLLLEGRSSVTFRKGSKCRLLVLRDRRSRISLEEKLVWAAFNDPATKLPNLLGFCSRIGQRVQAGECRLDGRAMVIAISLGRLGFFAGTLGEATRSRIVLGRKSAALRRGQLFAERECSPYRSAFRDQPDHGSGP